MRYARLSLGCLAVAAACLAPALSAQQLCTTFSGGNGFAGNMWDAQVAVDLTIESLDCHLDQVLGSATVEFYVRTGSHITHETSPAGWTLVDTVTTAANGAGVPSNVDIVDLALPSGTYGMYVNVASYPSPGIDYTDGTSGNLVWSNADLTTVHGAGRGNPAFTGALFRPRVWNGCLHYKLGGGLLLRTASSCPGTMTFTVRGATPSAGVALLRSLARGSKPVGTPCGRVTIGLINPGLELVAVLSADASGNAVFTAPVPGVACGLAHAQAVDLVGCQVSNVLDL